MNDYRTVQLALEGGAQPAMLCVTCPWDRTCISPPAMTSAEVQSKMDQALNEDRQRAAQARAAGESPGIPAGSLLTALIHSGRDVMGEFCPVFALRLRSGDGRRIADSLKASMQEWDDQRG